MRAADGRGATFEKTFLITVDDVNEAPPNEAPTDISLSDSTVAENEPAGTDVGTLSTADPDSGDSHTYSLVSGAGSGDNGSFEIDGSTLKTKAPLDFEQKPSLSIRVKTDDGKGGAFEETFTITVDDANDAPTDIALSPASVDENEPAGTEVGTLSAADQDAGASHSFSLVSGTGDGDNSSFEIDGSKLETKASFDFEQKASYSIRVEADDGNGSKLEKMLTVTVDDVNEDPTNISRSDSTVAENEPGGTAVGTLSTTDPDSGDNHTYSLFSGAGDADNGAFEIDGSTLKTKAPLDFEQKPSYSIRVKTDDGNGGTFEKTFTIDVEDANDAPTDIALSRSDIDENKPAESEVGSLSSTDQDAGDTHTYSLVPGQGSGDNSSFQIDGSKLETKASFNFEQKASYSIRVKTDDGNGGTFEKTFTIDVEDANDAPTAANDSYSGAIGNTKAQVQTTSDGPVVTLSGNVVVQNDSDEDGDSISAVSGDVISTGGGSATINADGSFTFLPGVGDKNQTDSFSYKVRDSEGAESTGTVSVGIVNELVWYVDGDATANGDGRSASPFKTLSNVAGASGGGDPDGTGDVLFLYSATPSYTGGLPLEGSQRLIGEPEGLSVSNASGPQQLVAAGGSNPTITNAAGDGIQLANASTIRRVSVGNASGDGIAGSNVNSADVGPNLSVNGPIGADFKLSGGNGNVTFGGAITNTAGRSVDIQNRSGGTVTLSGSINDTGGGVSAQNNDGATVDFTSGSVQLNTGPSDAFKATGGGTARVSGTNNTITTTTGTPLTISGTGIGAGQPGEGGLNFKAISANGAPSGIVLNNTGTAGGLKVAGTGGNCTLASPTCSGGTIQNTTGDGISLASTRDVSLSNLRVKDTGRHGIAGTAVTNLSLSNSIVESPGNADDEDGIHFATLGANNLSGAASFQNVAVTGMEENGLYIRNESGTLALTVSDSSFSNSLREDGILLETFGTSSLTALVQNSTFSGLASDGFKANANAGTLNVTAQGNAFTGCSVACFSNPSDNAISFVSAGSATMKYTIGGTASGAGNTMNNSHNSAMILQANDRSVMDGRVLNNTITSTTNGNGIDGSLAADDDSRARLLIEGNTVSGQRQGAMFFNANNTGDLDVTLLGNTMNSRPSDTTAFENLTVSANGTSIACTNIRSNSVAPGGSNAGGLGVSAAAFRLDDDDPPDPNSTVKLERGVSTSNDPAQIVRDNNPTSAANGVSISATITPVPDNTCALPTTTPTP
ncbi:MAG: cadherin domain-containing protein [Actinomycetota bacterium]|nr:cadherin domain-containing protein [Actinomycetota bacterium]